MKSKIWENFPSLASWLLGSMCWISQENKTWQAPQKSLQWRNLPSMQFPIKNPSKPMLCCQSRDFSFGGHTSLTSQVTTGSHSMLQRYPQLSAATAEDLLSSLVLSQSNFHVCLSGIWACKSLSIITLRCSNIEPPPRLNGYWNELFTSPLFCSVYCSYENNSHYCARCAVILYFLSY